MIFNTFAVAKKPNKAGFEQNEIDIHDDDLPQTIEKILNKPNFARNSAKVLPAIKFQSALAHVGLGTDGTLFTLG